MHYFVSCQVGFAPSAERKGTSFKWLVALVLEHYRKSNVGFWREGKIEGPAEKPLSVQSREPTNSTHIWRQVWESNPGHIGWRRVLSPPRHPAPKYSLSLVFAEYFPKLVQDTSTRERWFVDAIPTQLTVWTRHPILCCQKDQPLPTGLKSAPVFFL